MKGKSKPLRSPNLRVNDSTQGFAYCRWALFKMRATWFPVSFPVEQRPYVLAMFLAPYQHIVLRRHKLTACTHTLRIWQWRNIFLQLLPQQDDNALQQNFAAKVFFFCQDQQDDGFFCCGRRRHQLQTRREARPNRTLRKPYSCLLMWSQLTTMQLRVICAISQSRE